MKAFDRIYLLFTICVINFKWSLANEEEALERVVYEFNSETNLEGKHTDFARTVIKSKLIVDTLMYDEQTDIVGKIMIVDCSETSAGVNRDCKDDNPTLFFHIDSASLQVKSWHGAVKATKWNVLLAAATMLMEMHDQYDLEAQRVLLPVGKCRRKVRETEAKDEIQRVFDCEYSTEEQSLAFQLPKVDDLHYTQVNTIKDTEQTDVTSEETIDLRHALYNTSYITIHTQSRIVQTSLAESDDLSCRGLKLASECVAKQKSTLLGTTWQQLAHTVLDNKDTDKKNVVGSFLSTFESFVNSQQEFDSSINIETSVQFTKLVQVARQASAEDLVAAIKHPQMESSLGSLADVLAAAGTKTSFKVAKKHLAQASPDLFVRYLSALAFTPTPHFWLLEKLLSITDEKSAKPGSQSDVARLTLSSLLHRACVLNKCNFDVSNVRNKLLISTSKALQLAVKAKQDPIVYFSSLANMGTVEAAQVALPFICARTGAQLETLALGVLQRLPNKQWLPKMSSVTSRVLFNQCPHANSAAGNRILAAKLLLTGYKQNEHILRPIFSLIQPSQVDSERELASALLSITKQLAVDDSKFGEIVAKARNSGKYPTDYSRLAPGGWSSSVVTRISQGEKPLSYELDVQFAKQVFKTSGTSFSHGDQLLFGMDIFTTGLESIIGDDEDDSDDSDEVATEDVQPSGGMQIALFAVKQTPIYLFRSQSELMSGVFAADGTQHTALEANAIVDESWETLPLSSGLQVELRRSTSMSVQLKGGIEISIWNRNSKSTVNTKGSIGVTYDLDVGGLLTGQVHLSAYTQLQFRTDVEFYESPYAICMRMQNVDAQIRWDANLQNAKQRTLSIKRSRKLPDVTFKTHPKISDSCSHFG